MNRLLSVLVLLYSWTRFTHASCVVGKFGARLRDCPLHEVTLADGDEITLSFTDIEWSLPLIRGHRPNNGKFVDGWDSVDNGGELELEQYGEFSMHTKTLQLDSESEPRIPAPVIRIEKGARVKVKLRNDLVVTSSRDISYRVNIHTHGAHVSPNEDDSTVSVLPGEEHTYDYRFPKNHAGGTHWYHPHINTLGELHVSGGAVGAMIVEDGENGSEIPKFVQDLEEQVIVVQRIRPRRLQQVATGAINDPFSTRLYVRDELFGIGDDAPEDDNNFPYYLVNGFLQPKLEIEDGKWYRFRFVHSSSGNDINIFVATASADGQDSGCSVKLLAKDGVYLPGGARDVGTRITPMRFTPATRVDIAFRCTSEAGASARLVGKLLTEEYEEIETTLLVLPIEPKSDDAAAKRVKDFSFKPCLPQYLPDLRKPEYTVENKEEFNITISPFTINDRFWSGFERSPNISILELDRVYEWTMNHSHHSFHAHINHFLIVDRVDYWDQSGDYVDTIQALDDDHPIRFRFLTDKFDGRLTMHCHNLDHADEGAMAQGYILPPQSPEAKAKAAQSIPWQTDCGQELEFVCEMDDGGNCEFATAATAIPTATPTKSPVRSPTISPTAKPTSSPTKKPTARPTKMPTSSPTKRPTLSPNSSPTLSPTRKPSSSPTKIPTLSPTKKPTLRPTKRPTSSPTKRPTSSPTKSPVSSSPTNAPTSPPTHKPTSAPTKKPSASGTVTTKSPTSFPTPYPTPQASDGSNKPTQFPTLAVTMHPTTDPSVTLLGILALSNTSLPPNSDSVAAIEQALESIMNSTSTTINNFVSTGPMSYDCYFSVLFDTPEQKGIVKQALQNRDSTQNMLVSLQEKYGNEVPNSDLQVLGVRLDPEDEDNGGGPGLPDGGDGGTIIDDPSDVPPPGTGGNDVSGVALGISIACLMIFASVGVVLHRERNNKRAFERTVKRAKAIPAIRAPGSPGSVSLSSVGPSRISEIGSQPAEIVNVAKERDVFANGEGWLRWGDLSDGED